jgi:hypothetical protein
MSGRTVRDVINSIRSKNAGPFAITFDLFFPDADSFNKARQTDPFKRDLIASRYKLKPDDVDVYYFEPCLAVKISIPREQPCGTPGDRDMLGGQQFVPLLTLPVDF